MKIPFGLLCLAACASLAGCGGGAGGGASTVPVLPLPVDPLERGALVQNPPQRLQSLDPAAVSVAASQFGLFGSQLLSVAGSPVCGIDIHQVEYVTVGAAGEPTRASAALMVPTGAAPACSGKHPMLLYGHGSSVLKRVNMADLRPSANYGMASVSVATLFAAQGYIVLAPNYAGYDTSTLNYHPHHIADQNAKDMIDALSAARKALPKLATPVLENGKLFLSGYSEGGYVTMATHRAMQALGVTVTASAPLSGNYAESYGFETSLGHPELFAQSPLPSASDMLDRTIQFTAWQKAYGNLYANPAELYPAAFAPFMETLGPTSSTLAVLSSSGQVPLYLLGKDMPNVAALPAAQQAWYGPPESSLLKSSYIAPLLADIAAIPCPATSSINPLACATRHPARLAWFKNDLRTWTPAAPMLMCGGHGDTEVYFDNAVMSYAYFQAHGLAPNLVTVLDVDSPTSANDPYALAKASFIAARKVLLGLGEDPDSLENYHGTTAFAGCTVASRDFFSKF